MSTRFACFRSWCHALTCAVVALAFALPTACTGGASDALQQIENGFDAGAFGSSGFSSGGVGSSGTSGTSGSGTTSGGPRDAGPDGNGGGGLTLSIADATVAEGDVGTRLAIFTVYLSSPATSPVSVTYSTSDGTASSSPSAVGGADYTSTQATLSFAAGDTTRQLSIPIHGDTTNEADETFSVTLSSPRGASLGRAVAQERSQTTTWRRPSRSTTSSRTRATLEQRRSPSA